MILEIEHICLFLLTLPIVAFLYASVGHGGASGYLALMAIFSFAPETMKPTALLLNLFVAGIAFYHYYKAGHFNKKLFISFAIASIPFAFLGGIIEVDATIYKRILGVLLIFAILKMLDVFGKDHSKTQPGKVSGAQPFQGHKQMRIGLQKCRHTGHGHPQQNLVAQNQTRDRGRATPHAALGGRGNQGQIARARQEQ